MQKTIKYFCWAIFLIVSMNCIGDSGFGDSDLSDILEKLEKQHGSLKTLAVQFEQEKHFSFMDRPVISRGFMVFEVPDKIRFDITYPFQSSLLSDGKIIKRYEFIENKWQPIQFGGGNSIKLVMEQIGQWMQGKFADQKELFNLSAGIKDPNDYAILNLEPRHQQFKRYIERICIHISKTPDYRVYRIDIFEPQDDFFTLVFSDEQRNNKLPEGTFSNPKSIDQFIALFKEKQKEETAETGK